MNLGFDSVWIHGDMQNLLCGVSSENYDIVVVNLDRDSNLERFYYILDIICIFPKNKKVIL